MTIQPMMQVVKQWDATVANRALPFDANREAKSLLSDPDGYSMSHLSDDEATIVLRVAYGL